MSNIKTRYAQSTFNEIIRTGFVYFNCSKTKLTLPAFNLANIPTCPPSWLYTASRQSKGKGKPETISPTDNPVSVEAGEPLRTASRQGKARNY